MDRFPKAPLSLLDHEGRPHFGSYEGELSQFEPALDLPLRSRWTRRKGWIYLGVATPRRYFGVALVKLGYASSAFAFVFDRQQKSLVVDESRTGLPTQATFATSRVDATVASFRGTRTNLEVRREGCNLHLVGHMGALECDLRFLVETTPKLLAIHETPPAKEAGAPLYSATEKCLAFPVCGSMAITGKPFDVEALGGYDYSFGYPPRHTKWNWGFFLGFEGDGQGTQGSAVGINVTEGFVGAAECAAWTNGTLTPLGPVHFGYDEAAPKKPWSLQGNALSGTFDPMASHEERQNFGVVRSRFMQPAGVFRGELSLPNRRVHLANMMGVVEAQDSHW